MTGELLEAALRYAAAGWPVFPTMPNAEPCPGPQRCLCKTPLATLVPHGCKDATTDPAVIRRWRRRCPDANVAIACGSPGPDVLDVDQHGEAGNGFAAFGRLKRAGLLAGAGALVRTPSGGLHVYYLGSGQGNGKLPRHHIDFRGTGGYVLAPPSVVHGRPYELLDHRVGTGRLDWQAVRHLLDPPRPASLRAPRGDGDAGRLAEWVAAQQEGNRNDGLFWACCRAIEGGHADALDDLAAAAVKAGLTEAEAQRTVASAARKAGA